MRRSNPNHVCRRCSDSVPISRVDNKRTAPQPTPRLIDDIIERDADIRSPVKSRRRLWESYQINWGCAADWVMAAPKAHYFHAADFSSPRLVDKARRKPIAENLTNQRL